MAYELTTYFAELVKQYSPARNGLIEKFKSMPGNITEATKIEYDKIVSKGSYSRAKNRTGEPTMNGAEEFKNANFEPPIYKESCLFSETEMKKRHPGYDKYNVEAQTMALMEFTAEKVILMDDKIRRAETLQVSKMMHTGKILFKTDSIGLGVPDLDFESPSGNFTVLANSGAGNYYWNNAAATPWDNMETHCALIRANAGGRTRIDEIWFGQSALQALFANTTFRTQLDTLRLNLGGIDARAIDPNTGVGFYGTFLLDGGFVQFKTFDETYLNNSNVATPHLASNSIYFMGTGDYQVYHAGVDVVKEIPQSQTAIFTETTGAVRMISGTRASTLYVFTKANGENVELHIRKAPLYVPKTNDTFGRLQVLA